MFLKWWFWYLQTKTRLSHKKRRHYFLKILNILYCIWKLYLFYLCKFKQNFSLLGKLTCRPFPLYLFLILVDLYLFSYFLFLFFDRWFWSSLNFFDKFILNFCLRPVLGPINHLLFIFHFFSFLIRLWPWTWLHTISNFPTKKYHCLHRGFVQNLEFRPNLNCLTNFDTNFMVWQKYYFVTKIIFFLLTKKLFLTTIIFFDKQFIFIFWHTLYL